MLPFVFVILNASYIAMRPTKFKIEYFCYRRQKKLILKIKFYKNDKEFFKTKINIKKKDKDLGDKLNFVNFLNIKQTLQRLQFKKSFLIALIK